MASSNTMVYIILVLHFYQGTEVRGAVLTLVNNCSQTIWPAIGGSPRLESTGFELPEGSSRAFQAPRGWSGRFWGRTGCTFNDSGHFSCATGDCGSGRMECNTTAATAVTLAEFSLGSDSRDYYDVSVILGYNLPLLVDASSRYVQCPSTGCVEDMNRRCPPELRAEGGAACRGACDAFGTPEYCCTGNYTSRSACRPSNYSQLFKEACPSAFTYVFDDATSTFTCNSADYIITFCPRSSPQTGRGMSPAQSPGNSTPRSGNGKRPARVIIIVAALSITGVIIVFITIGCFLKRRHSANGPNQKCNQDVEKFLLQHGALAPKRYQYSEIKKITKSFSDKLGQGGCGSVYRGMLPDGSLVAVKVLIETDSDGEEFINEVASISKTSHVNIVGLVGFCYEKNKRALVYEFMPNRSLDKFISNDGSTTNTDCCLDLETLYKIAIGIAKGLEYLHTGCSTRIVHFDIKPQNILLDEDFCPKISDFGLAKLCKKKQSVLSLLGTRGTIGYIAPEIFYRDFGGASHKSDVYSYGMMVLEMAGARKVVETEVIQSSENYFPDKIYEQVIIDGTMRLDDRMFEEEEGTRRKMLLVGFWCLQTTPSHRPSMSKVVEMLEGSLQLIQIPPKPILFAPTPPEQNISSSFSAYVEIENSALD